MQVILADFCLNLFSRKARRNDEDATALHYLSVLGQAFTTFAESSFRLGFALLYSSSVEKYPMRDEKHNIVFQEGAGAPDRRTARPAAASSWIWISFPQKSRSSEP